jgi:hypothetical protein
VGSSLGWHGESNKGCARNGYSAGTAGDVNGDGRADILIGAPRMTSSVSDEGLVRLYLGSSSGVSSSYDWTTAGGQTLSKYGRSVGTAGDVNGDGYAEAIIGAPEYNDFLTDEGHAYVYFGNGGPGVGLRLLQTCYDMPRLGRLGHSIGPSFYLTLSYSNPFGRGGMLPEIEAKPLGSNFTGGDTIIPAGWHNWTDLLPGQDHSLYSGRLSPDRPYHWRMRTRYDPVTTPFLPASRWVTIPWNGWNEQDLRTGGNIIYFPLVVRNH